MAVVRRYHATTPAGFEPVAAWVDDCYSATDQLALDPESGELRISFENAPPPDDAAYFPEPELLKKTLFGSRYYKQPYFVCHLNLRCVAGTDPELADLEEPVSFSYPELGADGRTIFFAGNTDCDLTVVVTALDAELHVTDEIAYYVKHGYAAGATAWTSQGGIVE